MSSICGVFYRDGKEADSEIVERMVQKMNHWRPDLKNHVVLERAGFGYLGLNNTKESLKEELPYYDTSSGLLITSDARVDNRGELTKLLNFHHEMSESFTDSRFILEAYKKWNAGCLDYLEGDFVFVIFDRDGKKLFCARDHLGVKPFYYYFKNGVFCFASEIKGILAYPGTKVTKNEEWIADLLTSSLMDHSYTFYREIQRLPPASFMIVEEHRQRIGKYWELTAPAKIFFNDEREYGDLFREKLLDAVEKRTRSVYPLGSELSGGLDSSIVTSLALKKAREKNLKLYTFSHVLSPGYAGKAGLHGDEKKEIQEVLKLTKPDGHFFFVQDGRSLMADLERSIKIMDVPMIGNFHDSSDIIYKTASTNEVRTLLSGFGGDEAASSQAKYFYTECYKEKKWWILFKEMVMGKKQRLLPMVFFYALLKKKNFPFGLDELNRSNHLPEIKKELESLAISPDFLKKMKIEERLKAYREKNVYKDPESYHIHKLNDPRLALRMELCSTAGLHRRIEVRYPLLDVELLRFYLSVPLEMRRKNGFGRYLFRMASRFDLPETIRWRRDKSKAVVPGMPIPFFNDFHKIVHFIKSIESPYIDQRKMLQWSERLKKQDIKKYPKKQGAYRNALKILLLEEK